MRALFVHNRYRQSGGEDAVFAAETAILRKHGHEVVEYLDDNHRIYGLNPLVVAANTVWSYSSRDKLRQVLREAKPDVVHFHNTFLLISPAAYYACWETALPVIQTLHNYRLLCPAATFFRDGHVCEDCLDKTPPWPGVWHACYHDSRVQTGVVASMLTLHRLLKTWQNQVHIYIALTEFVRRKFIEGGLPEKKIVVKPNFVYSDPGMREGKGEYVLFVGRLSPEKGVSTLLKAWQNLKGIPLKIVGDGPLMEEVKAFVETHGLEKIEILGQRSHEEALSLIKGSRFLIFPSEWYETFGRVIIEAFACGVPVIASRLGAMEEIVEDERTGLHFEPGNSEDLAAKVEWAWIHTKEMQEMGREARREYELKYTAQKNYEMLMEIYRRAMEGSRRGH